MLLFRVLIINLLLAQVQSYSGGDNFFTFSETTLDKDSQVNLSESFKEMDFIGNVQNYFQPPYYGETCIRVNPTFIRKRISKVISSFSFRYTELRQFRKYFDKEILSSYLLSHICSINIFYRSLQI